MPELDTLRGIAVLLVVFFHAYGLLLGPYDLAKFHGIPKYIIGVSWFGWTGVNLFFALSGFLITGILIDSKGKTDYFKRFYFRRVLRILPAYYLVLVALPLLSLLPFFPRHVGLPFVCLSFVYCSNLVGFFGVQMQYGPLWSLAVEEHFYMLWPAVVKVLSQKILVLTAVILILASPALRLWTPGGSSVTWQNLDGLAMGALLAVLARTVSRTIIKRLAVGCITVSLVGFGVGVPFGIYLNRLWVGRAFRTSLIDLFFLGVLITFLLVGTSSFSGLVNIRWLKFYGFISYGLYLVHMVGFDIYDVVAGPAKLEFIPLSIRFGVVLLGCTLFCWLMRITFEEWFLRMKDRLPSQSKAQALNASAP